MNLNFNSIKILTEAVTRKVVKEWATDERTGIQYNDDPYDDEMDDVNPADPFDEYCQDYPNEDFDLESMSTDELAEWASTAGDFLYVYNSPMRGWSIHAANSEDLVNEIVTDIQNAPHLEHTHEFDKLLQRKVDFENDFIAVYKIPSSDGEYGVIYERSKM